MKKLLLIILVMFSASAWAQDAAFFSAIQDLPLMQGLREVPELTTTFDKPEGRIIESTALIESGTPAGVRDFYARTLPQMGWKPAGAGHYTRMEEELVLSFESGEGQEFLKVLVRPVLENKAK